MLSHLLKRHTYITNSCWLCSSVTIIIHMKFMNLKYLDFLKLVTCTAITLLEFTILKIGIVTWCLSQTTRISDYFLVSCEVRLNILVMIIKLIALVILPTNPLVPVCWNWWVSEQTDCNSIKCDIIQWRWYYDITTFSMYHLQYAFVLNFTWNFP